MTRLRLTRRSLRAAVGMFWLIAGALQLQSFMFISGFAHDVLGSAALSQPQPLHAAIKLAERVVAADPGAWNWVLALGELGIGAGLVLGRSGRVARAAGYASVAAGVAIWVVGEGVGGVFTGTAALSTGAPGSCTPVSPAVPTSVSVVAGTRRSPGAAWCRRRMDPQTARGRRPECKHPSRQRRRPELAGEVPWPCLYLSSGEGADFPAADVIAVMVRGLSVEPAAAAAKEMADATEMTPDASGDGAAPAT